MLWIMVEGIFLSTFQTSYRIFHTPALIMLHACLSVLFFSRMNEMGLSPTEHKVYFGQLLGMCDQISFPLGMLCSAGILKVNSKLWSHRHAWITGTCGHWRSTKTRSAVQRSCSQTFGLTPIVPVYVSFSTLRGKLTVEMVSHILRANNSGFC